jgi:hypothetical protein
MFHFDSSGSIKVFFKITFHVNVSDNGQIESSRVNATEVQQMIEHETERQQTTRTNGYLSTVMAGSITVKLANGKRRVYRSLFSSRNTFQCKEITVIIN